ncbi:MAG: TetR/AcrR family transcriptional regulator [Cyanobacteriota bacterium]|nr:TetR/AcrR family transcriptional regulator [Cyanobacteriota bacterium]
MHSLSVPRAAAIPAAERRAHAVRALVDLARHTAPDQISTAAIAERMGVSHGALFRHFPTKEALWAEAVSWVTNELETRFDASPPNPPLAQVGALMATHAAMLAEHPGLVRMFFAELQRPGTSLARETGKAFMQRFRRRLATLMASAQAEGTLDRELEPEELASLLVATQQGLMLQALAHDGFGELGERSRRSVALFLRTVAAAGPTAAPGG